MREREFLGLGLGRGMSSGHSVLIERVQKIGGVEGLEKSEQFTAFCSYCTKIPKFKNGKQSFLN